MQLLNSILNRIRSLTRLAVLTLTDSSGSIQIVQVKTGQDETLTDIEHREPYGFTSHPLPGADAIVIAFGGNISHSLALMLSDRRNRLTDLAEGEVALYDDQGQSIVLRRSGIEITAPLGYTITGNGTLNGDLAVNGGTTFTGSVSANGKVIDETHKHTDVQSGSSDTGAVK